MSYSIITHAFAPYRFVGIFAKAQMNRLGGRAVVVRSSILCLPSTFSQYNYQISSSISVAEIECLIHVDIAI